jgi:zinc protease
VEVPLFWQDWRISPPKPGPAPGLSLPVPQQFQLSNGLTVFLVEQHNLPIVSANVIVLSGSDRNAPEQPGLASFTAEMLDEGTRKRSTLQIAADCDQIRTSLSADQRRTSRLPIRTKMKRCRCL